MLGISLLAPAGLSALDVNLPKAQLIQQVGVEKPSDLVYDPFSPHAYVLSKGPPPSVMKYRRQLNGPWVLEDQLELPPGSDPQNIDARRAPSGLLVGLVVTDPGRRKILNIDPKNFAIATELDFPPAFGFPTGIADGFETEVAADFGLVTLTTSQPGSLWFPGPDFSSRLPFGDSIHPNGVSLLPDTAKPQKGVIQSDFLIVDAGNGSLLRVDDATIPSLIETLPGPPGAGGLNPPRDVAVVPLNLNPNPNQAGIYPIYVPVPQLDQVFQSPGPGGPWAPLFPQPIEAPVRADASCDSLAVTRFNDNLVDIFALQAPKGSICAEIAQLFAKGAVTKGGKLPVEVKAYLTATAAKLRAIFTGGGSSKSAGASGASASAVRSRAKKVDLEAGTVDKVKVQFSPGAIAILAEALQNRGRLKGKLKLEVTSPAGEKTTVTQPIVLRKR
jgi:hypothetical protein